MLNDNQLEDSKIERIRKEELELLRQAIKMSVYPLLDRNHPLLLAQPVEDCIDTSDPDLGRKFPKIQIPKSFNQPSKSRAERWVEACEGLGLQNIVLSLEEVEFFPSKLIAINENMVQISYELKGEERSFLSLYLDIKVFFVDRMSKPPRKYTVHFRI